MIDDTKASEYKREVMKVKAIMGKPLWELMLIILKGKKDEQPATVLKNELNIKYLWEQELLENHLEQKKNNRQTCSTTTIEDKHWGQVETATYICNLIMCCKLDCIKDTTTEYLQFLLQAKEVTKGIVWN